VSINNPCIAFHAACLPPQAKANHLNQHWPLLMDIQLLESGENSMNMYQDMKGAMFTESVVLPGVSLNDVENQKKDNVPVVSHLFSVIQQLTLHVLSKPRHNGTIIILVLGSCHYFYLQYVEASPFLPEITQHQ
jgi:hypothetical protein